jgi:hypothetical protein
MSIKRSLVVSNYVLMNPDESSLNFLDLVLHVFHLSYGRYFPFALIYPDSLCWGDLSSSAILPGVLNLVRGKALFGVSCLVLFFFFIKLSLSLSLSLLYI